MDLQVTLGGHTAPWRYRGSRAMRAWFESQPWLRGGGAIVLHVGAAGDPDLILDSIRTAIRASDDAGYSPDVISLTLDERLIDQLKLEVCGSSEAGERDLADGLAVRPRVVVVFTSTAGADLARDAGTFSDRARKLAPDFRVAFLIVSLGVCPDDNALDLERGAPDEHVLRLLDETQERLFRGYLHARIAWEAGGALALARALDLMLQNCRVGDDVGLEGILNKFSDGQLGELNAGSQRVLDEFLTAVVQNAARDLRRTARDARAVGLLWSPFGRDRLRLVPWVARAVLRRDRLHPCGPLLRSHMICAPFARELLGRCLELEARERAKLTWSLGAARAPSDALARQAAFDRDDLEGDAGLYPNCSPARPADAWAFAEFGAFIEAATRANAPGLPKRDLHALRNLRNALAHGHYASWAALRRLLDIERRLGSTF